MRTFLFAVNTLLLALAVGVLGSWIGITVGNWIDARYDARAGRKGTGPRR